MAYIPTKKQAETMLEILEHRHSVLQGAVRSGKTWSLFFVLPILIQMHKNDGAVICCKTLATTEQNILSVLRKIYGPEYVSFIINKDYCLIFGKKFYIRPFNDEGAKDRLQGASYGLGIVDEATLAPESFLLMLRTRFDVEGYHIIYTLNPSTAQHSFKRWMDTADVDLYTSHWTIYDNSTLPESVVHDLERAYVGNPIFYKRYILGMWVSSEGLAYYGFDENSNIVSYDDIDMQSLRRNTKYLVVGVDGSVIKDKTAAVPAIITRSDRATIFGSYVYDPQIDGPIDDVTQARKIAKFLANFEQEMQVEPEQKFLIVDCAAAGLALALEAACPDYTVIRFTQKQSQKNMVETVNTVFAHGKAKIVKENNQQLITELQTVRIKESLEGKYNLNPEDPNDVSDALKYLIRYYYKYIAYSEDIPE